MLSLKELDAFAKSIDLHQPAQSAQPDVGLYFSLSLNFLYVIEMIEPFCIMIKLVIWRNIYFYGYVTR